MMVSISWVVCCGRVRLVVGRWVGQGDGVGGIVDRRCCREEERPCPGGGLCMDRCTCLGVEGGIAT